MPCMGPSQADSYRRADKIVDAVMTLLSEQGIKSDHFYRERDKELFLVNQHRIRESLREMIWLYDADSF